MVVVNKYDKRNIFMTTAITFNQGTRYAVIYALILDRSGGCRPRKKLGRLFEQPSSLPPQATRPSTSGGPVAFRPLITQGLALSRETFCAQILKNRVGTISFGD